jgi:hypothetical protein
MTLFWVWILVRLPWQAKRQRAPAILIAAATFQPVSLLLGINLSFFIPGWSHLSLSLHWLSIEGRAPLCRTERLEDSTMNFFRYTVPAELPRP